MDRPVCWMRLSSPLRLLKRSAIEIIRAHPGDPEDSNDKALIVLGGPSGITVLAREKRFELLPLFSR
jgi:hypothetical protein